VIGENSYLGNGALKSSILFTPPLEVIPSEFWNAVWFIENYDDVKPVRFILFITGLLLPAQA